MKFPESEKYLLSLGNEVSAMKLGLENIRTLLAALGDPLPAAHCQVVCGPVALRPRG